MLMSHPSCPELGISVVTHSPFSSLPWAPSSLSWLCQTIWGDPSESSAMSRGPYRYPVVTVATSQAPPFRTALLRKPGLASDMNAMWGVPEASTAMDGLAPALSTSLTSHEYLAAAVGGDAVSATESAGEVAALGAAVAGGAEVGCTEVGCTEVGCNGAALELPFPPPQATAIRATAPTMNPRPPSRLLGMDHAPSEHQDSRPRCHCGSRAI